MSTVHLETIEVIYYFENRIQERKQKAVWSVVIGIWEGETKKGISCILLTPLVYKWRPRRDLNSCRRRERTILRALHLILRPSMSVELRLCDLKAV